MCVELEVGIVIITGEEDRGMVASADAFGGLRSTLGVMGRSVAYRGGGGRSSLACSFLSCTITVDRRRSFIDGGGVYKREKKRGGT